MSYRAVIFDLGGVVFPSPLDAFRTYERSRGLPERFLSRVVLGDTRNGAWSRLERGELDLDAFASAFEAECAAAGAAIDAAELMAALAAGMRPRAEMVGAVGRIRGVGLRTAALTNNWAVGNDTAPTGVDELGPLFDVIVESAVEGLRKPDPRIYELTCTRLAVAPREAVFLDDLGTNLKPARAMGMATIKVSDPAEALDELAALLGVDLGVGVGSGVSPGAGTAVDSSAGRAAPGGRAR